MKYCEGKCRRKYINSEGNAYACRYNKSFIIDKEHDDKRHEICIKPNYFINFWNYIIRLIWSDIVEMDDIGGGRESSRIERNQNLFKDRNEKLL